MTRLSSFGFVLLSSAFLATLAQGTKSDRPVEPQWKRLLTEEGAQKAAAQIQRVVLLTESKKPAEAQKLADEILAERIKLQGKDHWQIRSLQVDLREANQTQNVEQTKAHAEAKDLYRQVLQHFNVNRIDDAMLDTRKALDVLSRANLSTTRFFAMNTHNLGVLQRKKGNLVEAESNFLKAIEQRRTIYAGDHPDVAESIHGLANVYRAKNQFEKAEKYFLEAGKIRDDCVGPDHPSNLSGMRDLASCYYASARYSEAERLLKTVLEVEKTRFGTNHKTFATNTNDLGEVYRMAGRLADAERLLVQSVEVTRIVHGAVHPDLALRLNNLALTLQLQGQLEKADSIYQESQAIAQQSLPESHPQRSVIQANFASLRQAQGRLAEAESMLQIVRSLHEKHNRRVDPDHAVCLNNLGSIYQSMGDRSRAEHCFQQSLQMSRALYGEEHPAVAACLFNLASIRDDLRDYAVAEQLFLQSAQMRRRLLGSKHPDFLTSISSLGNLQLSATEYEKAEKTLKLAEQLQKEVLGDRAPEYLATLNNLAMLYIATDRPSQATPILEKARFQSRLVFGQTHPRYGFALLNLGAHYQAIGQLEKAEDALTECTAAYEAGRIARGAGFRRAQGAQLGSPYVALACLYARKGKSNDAILAFEKHVARALLDELSSRAGVASDPAQVVRVNEINGKLAKLDADVRRLVTSTKEAIADSKKLDELITDRRRLADELATIGVQESETHLSSITKIRSSLPPRSAMVGWVDLDTSSGVIQDHWAFVIRSDRELTWVRLPGLSRAEWTVDEGLLTSRLRIEFATDVRHSKLVETVSKLRKLRFEPLRKHLEGIDSLYVVPANSMAGVPVELMVPECGITYVPSGSFFARQSKPNHRPASLLALGDPIYEAVSSKSTDRSSPSHGLLIQIVQPGSSAARAGLVVGDVLLKYNDVVLKTTEDLRNAMSSIPKGAKDVPLTLWRVDSSGKPMEVIKQVSVGPLGAGIGPDPAPVAFAKQIRLGESQRDWKDLPGTRVEVDRISKLFDQKQVFVDAEASKGTIEKLRLAGKLTEFRYLHFATHGTGNRQSAFESALILSQFDTRSSADRKSPVANSQLTAKEVLELWKLDADLVTLSACESAVGRYAQGEGILGFGQAFLLAGARCVCLSLWKVDDVATALLMVRFYENLLGKRPGDRAMSKADALHEAKRWLQNLSKEEVAKLSGELHVGIDRGERGPIKAKVEPGPMREAKDADKPYAHPRFWAAFILIGDPR